MNFYIFDFTFIDLSHYLGWQL